MNAKLLEGKTAVVTGASKGIGKAIAELFAEEGANVVLTARGQQTLDEVVDAIEQSGGNAIGVAADSSDPAAPERVFATAIKGFGQVAPDVTDTDAAAAWASGKQIGGSVMLEFAQKYVNLTVPITKPLDQAYTALYLGSDMGAAVTGQVIQVDNGGWL